MDKLSELMESVKRKMKRTDAEGSSLKNVSMAEGVEDKIYGINRKVVYLVLLFIITAFLGFSFFSSMDSDGPNQTAKAQHTEEIADKSMVNSSRQMQQMNAKRQENQDMQKQKGQGGQADNHTAANNAQARPASASYSSPYPVAAQTTAPAQIPISAPVQRVEAVTPAVRPEKEEFDSEIGFHVGTSSAPVSSVSNLPMSAMAEPISAQQSSFVQQAAGIQDNLSYIPSLPNSLQAGTVIPAVLLTGIDTAVGGQVIAQIERDVYDSLTGSILLIPAGSRIIGSYQEGVKQGQRRVGVQWNILQLPNGGCYQLGNSMIAADLSGYAGIPGTVHHHTGGMFRTGILTSAIAALGSVASGNTRANTSTYTAGQLAGQGAMANLMNTTSTILQKEMMNAGPTITVGAGSEFCVFVTQTLQFGQGS